MLKFFFTLISLSFTSMGGTAAIATKKGVDASRCERELAHHALPIFCHPESVRRFNRLDKMHGYLSISIAKSARHS